MNTADFTLTSTVVAAALGLALGLMAAPALADKPTDGCHVAHEDCPPAGGDETTSGGNHNSALIFTLTDTDTLENDGNDQYVHNEGHVKALAGHPHKPGVLLSLRGGGSNPRTLMVSADCIDTFGNCGMLPPGFLDVERAHVNLDLRPYENSCPELLDDECPDIFTMGTESAKSEVMSFRILFHDGLMIEAASNIGGGTSPNPGQCLSRLDTGPRDTFIAACVATPETCNVTVTAFDDGDSAGFGMDDGENDEWQIRGTNVRAIICDLSTNTNTVVIGETTITVILDAIKR